MPIGHVLLRFYTTVLNALGLQKLPGFPEGMAAFGIARPEFVLLASDKSSNAHVAFPSSR
ncbi:hypothetical protein Trco_006151 [Trichoderma cornu-damae]|uniref:Uncharacterized protein n=1 Tax=Trichoderma cornu-damae TaxID=654480 RepID=A0A9P8TW21_9HYPO|nr:hypothetical protein Trco_006151 [Trichoderma cornu-damae]